MTACGPATSPRLAEERGSGRDLLRRAHAHPSRRDRPRAGKPLPPKYWHTYDLFVRDRGRGGDQPAASWRAASASSSEADPIITAKEVASVDHLSGGRLEIGVGAGWNRTEMAHHGTDPRTRMAIAGGETGRGRLKQIPDETTSAS
jgi:hypothetical protein